MKKIVFFSLVFFLCMWMASAQDEALFKNEKVMHLTRPGSDAQMESLKLKSGSWMLDSSWYSQWLTSTQQWMLFQREFFQYNSSFQRTQDLYLAWNSSLGVWQNSTRYLTLYTGSGGLASMSGQTWYPTGSYWVTTNYLHFNDQGRTDTSFGKSYDPNTNKFSGGYMSLSYYYSSGMTSQIINLQLDTASGTWINSMNQLYSYSASNKISEYLVQQWNTGSNAWVNLEKTDYSYDGSGYSTGYVNYQWNTASSQWIQSTQDIFTNNTSGVIMIDLQQQWMATTSSWRNKSQVSYQYNTGNQLTQRLTQDWDTLSSIWVNYSKAQFNYYTNNFVKEYSQWEWNPLNSTWMETWYSLSDSTGYQTEYYSKTLDHTTYTYIFGYRYTYSYNTSNQCTEYDHYDLNLSTLNWDITARRLYTYNADGNNTIQLDQNWDPGSSAWVNYFKIENFFSIYTGVREKPGLSSVCTFANPMQKGETINCPNLSPGREYTMILLNVSGQGMLHFGYHGGEPLQLPSSLATGMYLLQILDHGQTVSSGKVIIN